MKAAGNIEASEAIELAKGQLPKLTQLKVNNVVGVKQDKDGWHVTFELIEKRSIPDAMDVLGVYDLILDEKGKVVSLERKGFRRRGDT